MAISQYRIQFQRQYMSFNGGDIAYFDAVTGGRLAALGIGTALDALPAAVPVPAGTPPMDVVDDGGLPVPASVADSNVLQSEAGMLGGG